MHFAGRWTSWIWNFFSHVVDYTSLRENSISILEKTVTQTVTSSCIEKNSCKVCLLFYCFLVMIASKSSILIHPLTLGFFLFTYNHSQNIYDRQKFTCEIAHYENFNFCFSEVFTSNDKIFISWRGPSTRQ